MNPTQLYTELFVPNFLNPASITDLNNQLDEVIKNKTRFLVLKGSETVFCNGLDLKWVTNHPNGNYAPEMAAYATFLKKLQTESFISIAAVSGAVSGGGLGLVCACDHVIATEDSTFSLPEGLLGIIPGIILPSLLNRILPYRIKTMVLTGKKYPASIAKEWDIVNEVVAPHQMEATIQNNINTMKSCKINAVGDIKKMLYNHTIDKDQLGLNGINNLINKLKEPEVYDRLKNLVEFMDEE